MIIVSELGDKTFFISAIMAMKHSRLTVFLAANSAMALMTVLSVGLGIATSIISQEIIHYLSVVLFLGFGLKLLWDGYKMTDEEGKEELENVQNTITKKDQQSYGEHQQLQTTEDPETGIIKPPSSLPFKVRLKRRCMHIVSLVFIETFVMALVAEMGDRSQITTIVLAARESCLGVALGAFLGHTVCNTIAVLGGRIVAAMISVKTVTIIGGLTFLVFALTSALFNQ